MKYASLVILLAQFVASEMQANDNWPQWRGANLDNVSAETGLPAEFGTDKNMLWRFELPGPGGASPIVWEDRIFVTSVDEADSGLVLICLNTKGVEQWRRRLQGENQNTRMDAANYASPSPSTDGSRVYANTGAGFLECFDMDGNPVWSVDLQQRYGKFNIQFGMTSTPVLDNGRLYLQMIHGSMRERSTSTGMVVAIDAGTGEGIWQHERKTNAVAENKHSYASPIVVRDGDREFLVTHGGDYVIGHSLDDGSELWRCGGMNPQGDSYNNFLRFVASPMYRDGMLIVPSAKNGPVLCLKTDLSGDVTGDPDAFHWILEEGTPDVSTPLYCKGLVFLTRENGVVRCIDAESGDELFADRLLAGRHRSSPVYADDKVFIAGRDGTIVVLAASPELNVLAENELAENTTASPAIANGRIYIRTANALYCFGS